MHDHVGIFGGAQSSPMPPPSPLPKKTKQNKTKTKTNKQKTKNETGPVRLLYMSVKTWSRACTGASIHFSDWGGGGQKLEKFQNFRANLQP